MSGLGGASRSHLCSDREWSSAGDLSGRPWRSARPKQQPRDPIVPEIMPKHRKRNREAGSAPASVTKSHTRLDLHADTTRHRSRTWVANTPLIGAFCQPASGEFGRVRPERLPPWSAGWAESRGPWVIWGRRSPEARPVISRARQPGQDVTGRRGLLLSALCALHSKCGSVGAFCRPHCAPPQPRRSRTQL